MDFVEGERKEMMLEQRRKAREALIEKYAGQMEYDADAGTLKWRVDFVDNPKERDVARKVESMSLWAMLEEIPIRCTSIIYWMVKGVHVPFESHIRPINGDFRDLRWFNLYCEPYFAALKRKSTPEGLVLKRQGSRDVYMVHANGFKIGFYPGRELAYSVYLKVKSFLTGEKLLDKDPCPDVKVGISTKENREGDIKVWIKNPEVLSEDYHAWVNERPDRDRWEDKDRDRDTWRSKDRDDKWEDRRDRKFNRSYDGDRYNGEYRSRGYQNDRGEYRERLTYRGDSQRSNYNEREFWVYRDAVRFGRPIRANTLRDAKARLEEMIGTVPGYEEHRYYELSVDGKMFSLMSIR